MDNTTRQAMFAAYWGCEVQAIEDETTHYTGKMIALNQRGVKMYGEDFDRFSTYQYCKLLLTPLSKITDEHAQILTDAMNKFVKTRPELQQFDFNADQVKFVCGNNPVIFTYMSDILRQLGYDLGFRDLVSLIAAGYAVDKTLSNG